MTGSETSRAEEDLTYIRGAVERMESAPYESVTIAAVWAVITAGGFAINDFRPQWAMFYWPIACFSGYLFSLLYGRSSASEAGEACVEDVRKHAIHWGSIFAVCLAGLAIGINHGFDGPAFGQLFTLLAGAGCFLGGLHLDRRFMLPGVLLIIGAPAIDYLPVLPWTTVGVATGVSLVFSAYRLKPSDG